MVGPGQEFGASKPSPVRCPVYYTLDCEYSRTSVTRVCPGVSMKTLEPTPPVDELIIGGPRGELRLRMAAMSPSAPVQVFDADGKLLQQLEFEPPEHAAQRLVQSMTDELRGVSGARCPSRADNAVRTSRVLDAALGSYYGGREDECYWARPESWPGRPQQQV